MRKTIILLLSGIMMLGATGCGNNKVASDQNNVQQTTNETAIVNDNSTKNQQETTKAVSGVNTLSLYINNKDSGYREKSSGFESAWVKGEDIVSFEAYATKDDKFTLATSNFKNVWESYWHQFDSYEKCKIGYTVEFDLKNSEKVKKTILGPDDVFEFRDYLECYLYDDVNQIQGNWYSHLLDTQVTAQTVMTSIKFTAGVNSEQMGDTITLTAFVYNTDENEFDAEGNYIGPVSYQVKVKNTAK